MSRSELAALVLFFLALIQLALLAFAAWHLWKAQQHIDEAQRRRDDVGRGVERLRHLLINQHGDADDAPP